jgi:mannose PTS system EIIA component
MVGFIVVTHGQLATELIKTAEHIVGKLERVTAIAITPDCSPDSIREKISSAIESLKNGDGILILTDLFGGTPSNISLSFLEDNKVEVVTGVNLPMMIKLSTLKDGMGLGDLAQYIKAYGRENISVAGELLKGA